MSISDLVWLSIGETILAATFALGILVGVSMQKRSVRYDDSNEGTSGDDHDQQIRFERGSCGRSAGCAAAKPEADLGKRQAR
ncbi:MAG: hypothetical protein WD060_10510 [Pirellulales bacterium]